MQISELSTDTDVLHPDVAGFHFDDCQRVIHISGCILRSAKYLLYTTTDMHNTMKYNFSGQETSLSFFFTQTLCSYF